MIPQSASRPFSAALLLESNDPSTPAYNVNLNATRLLAGAQMLANPNFEAAPFNLGWVADTNVFAQGGFAPGSATAVRLSGPGQRLGQNLVCSGNWHLETWIAVDSAAGGAEEAFSVYVNTISDIYNTSVVRFRLRYQNGQFLYGSGTALPGLGALLPSVDANNDGDLNDPQDTKNVYHLRVTGRAWGATNSTVDVELSDPNSPWLDRVVTGLAVNSGGGTPTAFAFDTLTGASQGFWADDTRLVIGLPAPRQPRILDFTTTTDGNFTITWASDPGATYRVMYSTDLKNWDETYWPVVPSQGATTSLTDLITGADIEFFKIRRD